MRLTRLAAPVLLLTAIVFAGVAGPGANALAGSPLPTFDICLQDESKGNILQFNSTTGAFLFTHCPGTSFSGMGTIRKKGCLIALEVAGSDRRVQASTDTCAKIGSASLLFPTNQVFTIQDRNTANNTCVCSTPM